MGDFRFFDFGFTDYNLRKLKHWMKDMIFHPMKLLWQ